MHITPEQVSNIQKIAQAGVSYIAELSLTDRKTLSMALKTLSKESAAGVVQKDLEHSHKIILSMNAKMEIKKKGLTALSCWESIWSWLSNIFAPSASQIKKAATNLHEKLLQKERRDIKSLPQEIKMLGKKIEDIKVGLSYVEDHNIPVTEANLKFLESVQGKNLEESQQLFQERIEALDREIHDMPTKEGQEDRTTALEPILKSLKGLLRCISTPEYSRELVLNIAAHRQSLDNARDLFKKESLFIESEQQRLRLMIARLSELQKQYPLSAT